MSRSFSNLQRSATRTVLQAEVVDLLVIGGGATGAGVLLDATVRGIKVALVEMQDFAAGTSSRSTKLIHGGLRYLKQLQISLVAEVGKERAVVYENAPHVTTPEWMLLPIVRGGSYGKLATSVGIRLYDYLAGVKRSERRQMLSAPAAMAAEPLLHRDILLGAGRYVEYRTDDARLTLEIIKEAVNRGGLALHYSKVTRLLYAGGRVCGARVCDLISGEEYEIRATVVVNATGPWVDTVRDMDHRAQGKKLHLTKGVHIVVDGERFPLQSPVYFDVPDGRMIFAVPREGKVYIGTTDTDYPHSLEHPRMTSADLHYLVLAVNYMFPSVELRPEDVESSWSGVRPLIQQEGKGPSEISRREEVFRSDTGLITIAGGKLTGYRKMAEKVVDVVASQLSQRAGKSYPPCSTSSVILSGGHVGGGAGFSAFVANKIEEASEVGVQPETASRLVHRYGSNIDVLYDILRHRADEAVACGLDPDVFAMLVYGIEHEMVYSPDDFFTRRTSSTYFRIDWARRWQDAVTRYLGQQFGWDDAKVAAQTEDFGARLREAVEPID